MKLKAFKFGDDGSSYGYEVGSGDARFLVSRNGEVTKIDDRWEEVHDYGISMFQTQQNSLENSLQSKRNDMHSYETSMRQIARDIKALAKQYTSLEQSNVVAAGQAIEGVLDWAVSDKAMFFMTKCIIASDIVKGSDQPDIVVGCLEVSMNFRDKNVKVKNLNRTVLGYDSVESPHPHWTGGGICLGEYSMPFEECLVEGMLVEAIEQLMLHFTSYNSSDGAGLTASRWVLDTETENDIIAKYETITHGELL